SSSPTPAPATPAGNKISLFVLLLSCFRSFQPREWKRGNRGSRGSTRIRRAKRYSENVDQLPLKTQQTLKPQSRSPVFKAPSHEFQCLLSILCFQRHTQAFLAVCALLPDPRRSA